MAERRHVITRKYTQYWDPMNDVSFTPITDVALGVRIGHAHTDADFSQRQDFQTLTDAQYAALISGTTAAPAAPGIITGDPLGDAALGAGQSVKGSGADPLAAASSQAAKAAADKAAADKAAADKAAALD